MSNSDKKLLIVPYGIETKARPRPPDTTTVF